MHLAESVLDGVGGSDTFALLRGLVAEADEQVVEIGAQAPDGLRIVVLETIGAAAGGPARLWQRVGMTAELFVLRHDFRRHF